MVLVLSIPTCLSSVKMMDCRSDHQSSRASSKISKLMHVCCQQVCNKLLKNLVRYSDDSDADAAAAENDNSIKMVACSNKMVQENNQKHDGDNFRKITTATHTELQKTLAYSGILEAKSNLGIPSLTQRIETMAD